MHSAGISKIIMNANTRTRLGMLESKVGPINVQGSMAKKIKAEPLPQAMVDSVTTTEDDEVNLVQELRSCLMAAASMLFSLLLFVTEPTPQK